LGEDLFNVISAHFCDRENGLESASLRGETRLAGESACPTAAEKRVTKAADAAPIGNRRQDEHPAPHFSEIHRTY
jgi:hypothetical protein